MNEPRIYVDFQNADADGRLRLTCDGTMRDLAATELVLSEGQRLFLYSDDGDSEGSEDNLLVEGTVHFSVSERIWVASINWDEIRHESDLPVRDNLEGKPLNQPLFAAR